MAIRQAEAEKRLRKYATPANVNNRVGVIWTPQEEAQLKEEIFSGLSLQEIANLHHRAPKAIELRSARLAAGEVTEENPVQVVCSKYRVTETMVNYELKRKNKPKKATLEARVAALEEEVQRLRELLAKANLI